MVFGHAHFLLGKDKMISKSPNKNRINGMTLSIHMSMAAIPTIVIIPPMSNMSNNFFLAIHSLRVIITPPLKGLSKSRSSQNSSTSLCQSSSLK